MNESHSEQIRLSPHYKVSVVLPSYNEKGNIKEAIERISKALGSNLYEIIIVDDNSPDRTWKIVEDINKLNKKVKLIRRMNDKGLASALSDGINSAKGNVIAWIDCDLGVPPEIIQKLVSKLDRYDVAIGSRYVKGGKDTRAKYRAFLSCMINFFSMIVLSFKLRDYTSGIVAAKKEVLENIKFSRKGFGEYFVEFAYKCIKKKYKIIEVGVVYINRKAGVSKSDGSTRILLKLGWDYGVKVLRLRFGL